MHGPRPWLRSLGTVCVDTTSPRTITVPCPDPPSHSWMTTAALSDFAAAGAAAPRTMVAITAHATISRFMEILSLTCMMLGLGQGSGDDEKLIPSEAWGSPFQVGSIHPPYGTAETASRDLSQGPVRQYTALGSVGICRWPKSPMNAHTLHKDKRKHNPLNTSFSANQQRWNTHLVSDEPIGARRGGRLLRGVFQIRPRPFTH